METGVTSQHRFDQSVPDVRRYLDTESIEKPEKRRPLHEVASTEKRCSSCLLLSFAACTQAPLHLLIVTGRISRKRELCTVQVITLHDKYMPRELFSEKDERRSAKARKSITKPVFKKGALALLLPCWC
jgi:hypothetical protein